ncbi:MAG: phycobilisome linker polypeptide [Limnoraphis robusta]|jgi:phycocyanin-associated rod linker protein|uniref:Phycobilisome linker polypeptide n=1 Tax=Limnoraphis robusta CCNP1315 TaxID=3110306 RepID=A0ABU5U0S7_9CYAN|nr:phycobilisome rod-core linker polypeptide [Limnoraphis robusta]MEA5496689.1 phycobilisome linker polypeptide [Limnoraphis robusta BA-68 BA1]MEA5520786.1 phycobilisome linker polypeptide [Limnoraphis robusta CCNP1315]MEA5541634.1 phycobilisome linker polypeptide [Limnoraphis robusta Tam1]MEA5544451.1 phycobilisome linker polypeptide [Limnoraphis robusta CCNP1324]
MTTLLVPANLQAAGRLGLDAFDGTKVELRPDWTESDLQAIFRATYRQVLGNEYVMKAERLTSAESLLRQGNLTVRDFVRAVALSELYKKKFFYPNNNQRFVELNFKHLLGRPPHDEQELAFHTRLVEDKGYDAEINSYFESEEYENKFGDNIVPYYVGFQVLPGSRTVGFTRMFQLYRGYANNDRGQVGSKNGHVFKDVARNQASTIPQSLGISAKSKIDAPQKSFGGLGNRQQRVYRVEVTNRIGSSLTDSNVRRSNKAYLVPYEELSSRMQQILRSGAKIVSVRET